MATVSGRWTPQHRADTVWPELPFEVPQVCQGLRIELEFERQAGVLDLGLIDPLGWRGWSGGAKSVVEIGPDSATPGYLDRGLPPGEWRVVLGLHRLPDGGLPYRLQVSTADVSLADPPAVPLPARRPARQLPGVDGKRWLAGDLHAHTLHSDGALTVPELAALGTASGLDFLAVTDHNTTSHHPQLQTFGRQYGLALLPGQEVTTADGHANAFGDVGWIDFRQPAAEWFSQVGERGGLLSINHPLTGDCAWRHPMTAPPPAAEIWHSSWFDRTWGAPLTWWNAMTALGDTPIPLGGSDFHRHGSDGALGAPTTWVSCADDSAEAVLAGLLAGGTAISAGIDGPLLLRIGDDLLALQADGSMLVCPDGRRSPVRADSEEFGDHLGPHILESNGRVVLAISS
ncbi:MAG: CehA/McbA family metallohydrolase [Actinomycetota bacterium]|nr:CehA/McbA family metallohydrolase [Actinomycetota bacterium]